MKQIRKDVKEINQALKQLNQDIDALAAGIMAKISQSTDEVSTALGPIFAKAEPHRDEELRRARNRKELGNPPGKQEKPLGDQITWEQILSRFASKQTLQKLWIITRDPDYGPVYGDRGFLNQFLYQELRAVSSRAEAFLFKDIVDGIKDFARTTGVEAIELPTGEEAAEIKKEIEALPPVGGHSLSPSAASLSLSGATPITGGQYLFTGGPQGIPLTLLSELLARKEEY